jgi:hypothetical protein
VVLPDDPAPAPGCVTIRAGISRFELGSTRFAIHARMKHEPRRCRPVFYKPWRKLEIKFQTGNRHGGRGIFTEYPARDPARSLRGRERVLGREQTRNKRTLSEYNSLYQNTIYDDSTLYIAELLPRRHKARQ